MQKRSSGLAAYALLMGLSSLLLGLFLWTSYQRTLELQESRLAFSSELIAEWIRGAFVASDYLLRDMVAQIDPNALRYPHPNPEAHADLSQRLEQRRKTFPHAFLYGAFNRHCVVTQGNGDLGYDASDREYCQRLQADPELDSLVTRGYRANVGPVNVTHARALRAEDGTFLGLVAIALKTDFFSQWLARMGTGRLDSLAIVDDQHMLLARYPPLPQAIGQLVDNPNLSDFLASDEPFRVALVRSPLDQKNRYFGSLKVEGTPFVIILGIDHADWLADWYRLAGLAVLGWILIMGLGFIALRNYLRLLEGRSALQQQARTDSLTGIANRFYFTTLAEREIARAQRACGWISLLLLDVDRFKTINDSHGHHVGDRALKTFAACCSRVTRAEDVVGRWGGDEFVVLISQDQTAALGLAERLLEEIRTAKILNDQGEPLSLNASIGVACLRADHPLDLDALLHQADLAMLDVKRTGRGRIGALSDSAALSSG
ncbi:MAG: GGDEF domain-containing protein [Lamprobacter sp.]|uniref:sensor domain-containing diguanylate cyclase n=1 Tax=Lamprobacter sp. TaxID=3100796 RepID=UPI002B262967|nr:GGDEF domain-containing protein [Lamprobacter sp.]MEA3639976.1 GGDEF domain-containing protein [Lamprobacter sp.]